MTDRYVSPRELDQQGMLCANLVGWCVRLRRNPQVPADAEECEADVATMTRELNERVEAVLGNRTASTPTRLSDMRLIMENVLKIALKYLEKE